MVSTHHTSKALQALDKPELWKVAHQYRVPIAGRSIAEIARAIVKAQANAEGKSTPADPKSGKRGLQPRKPSRKHPLTVDDGDEEITMPKTAAKKKPSKVTKLKVAAKPAAKKQTDSEKLDLILGLLVDVATEAGVKVPAELKGKKGKAAVAEEEEDETEEEEEEEDEEVAEEEEEEEEEEDETEEEEEDEEVAEEEEEEEEDENEGEEEGTLRLDVAEIKKATLERLVEIGDEINEIEEDAIDTTTEKPGVLRNLILEWGKENGAIEVEEEETPKKGTGSGFLKKGAKVQAQYEGKWFKAVIDSVDVAKKLASVTFDVDDSEAKVPFKLIKPRVAKAS